MSSNELLDAALREDGVERDVFRKLFAVVQTGRWVHVNDIDRVLRLPVQQRTHYLYAAKSVGLVCRKGVSHNKHRHVRITAVKANVSQWPAVLRGDDYA